MGRYGKQDMMKIEREKSVGELYEWVRAIDRLIQRENRK